MSSGIGGGSFRPIEQSSYLKKIREGSLNEERGDEDRRLAELEEFVRKHGHPKREGEPKDEQDLAQQPETGKEEPPEEPAEAEPEKEPEEKPKEPPEGSHRIDLTI